MADQTELPFCNKTMDRVAMRRLIGKLVVCFGIASTTNILDQVKILGFQQATEASVSLGIDDLLAVPSRGWLVQDAEKEGYISEQHYRLGSLHAVEKLRQSIEAWYATSECLKREMNPSFKMIDPLNPVHMMSFSGARGNISQVHQLLGMRGLMSDPRGQVIDLPIRRNLREGLSLTEYIISCYGARKGVVDTAVRTSDAGYLTRRLVEVAQHIAVRKKDCETTRSLTLLNTTEEKGESIGTISYQRLVGRVLADNVYWDVRCIATRNQDISDGLASNLIASAQPIHVRSPLTCRSIFWICQLCYGWSLAHHDLVELGEAVGIIAGQSIGEPGTQLTLRTFHTGGVFTGDIAEYVRISFNGLINFDEKLVHPTRTRHGHPAWMCRNDLPILIKSCGDVHNFVIPARSLLMIRNGQYVESQQIIAEVRAREFPLKERIQKYIYPNLEGEIHWSRFVWHVRDCIDSPIRVVSEAGHIWILSGASSDSAKNYSCHEDQDRVGIRPHSIEWRRNYSEEVDKEGIDVADSNGGDFQEGIREFGIDPKHFLNWSEPPICNYILSNIRVERSEGNKSVSLLLERRQENLSQSYFVSIDVQLNSILDEDDIFAVYENSEYQTRASGAIIYGTIKVEPIHRGTFGDGGTQEQTSSLRYRVVGGGNFFLIPEEIYTISEPPSSILALDNTIVQEGARITGTITSKVGGLIRIGNTPTSTTSVKILPGYICKPAKTTSKIKRGYNLVAPGDTIIDGIEANSWVYLQSVTLHRERKTSVLVRPVIEYDVSSDSLVQVAFCPDKPKTQRCAKVETLPHIFHKNGEKVENLDHAIIQLVRTCLSVGCRRYFCETLPTKKKYLSLTNVKINNLLDTFIQVNSMVSPPTRKIGVTRVFQKSMSVDESSLTQVDLSNSLDKLVPKYTVHSVSEQGASFLILSSLNFSRTTSFADSGDDNYEEKIGKYFHGSESSRSASAHIYRSSKKLPLSSKSESLSKNFPNLNVEERLLKSERSSFTSRQVKDREVGLLGTSWAISYPSVPPHSSLSGKISTVRKHFVNYPMQALEHHHSYLIDENQLILKCSVNPVLNRYLLYKPIYLPPKLLSRGVLLINLGLLIGGSRCLRKNSVCFQSGQIVAIHQDYSLARTGKTLLATRGAIPQKISGDTTGEGDTLLTLPYDRLKSGDITQGLPKVEQLLESRSIASIPARIEDLLGRWNRSITRLIGSLWSHYLSAGASMERCQLVLIDQIRKVYESQGVQISDKHLEIIIRQLTSRVVASEDGITNVFFPGELVELSQAERMNRVLKRSIFYEPIVLGMTKASLSTTSFLSEASFQETTRVLAKAALRGRIDWLKGLKENVILGDAVPIGTGSPEIVCQLKVNRRKEFYSAASGSSKNPNWETKNSLRAYCEK